MKKIAFLTLLFSLIGAANLVYAQFGEPEIQKKESPRNLYDEGYRTGFGFNFALNDFGFGAGGQFRFGLSRYTEALVSLRLSALKDPSEQTFIDYRFGFKTVPEKYQRVLAVPLYVGMKQRFFPKEIQDNFRLYASLSGGPVYALSYSYFNDVSENGFRENDLLLYGYTEQVNDIFGGWENSISHWGLGGELVVGIDFGSKFKNLSSVQFGYTFNYFNNGIQVLEPCSPNLNRVGQAPVTPCGSGPEYVRVFDQNGAEYLAPIEKANDPRKFFGSAQISFVFGWMW